MFLLLLLVAVNVAKASLLDPFLNGSESALSRQLLAAL